jgi:hypothetical protein
MAVIIIKDLAESVERDRQAMQAVTGGARMGGRVVPLQPAIFRSTKIINFLPEHLTDKAPVKWHKN